MSATAEQSEDLRLATRRALAAVAKGDLEILAVVLADRETAIASIVNAQRITPEQAISGQTISEQTDALREGQAICVLLTALRNQIVTERDRLARLSSTLAGSGPLPRAAVDLFG